MFFHFGHVLHLQHDPEYFLLSCVTLIDLVGLFLKMSNFHAAEGMFHGAFHIEGHFRNQICFEPFPAVGGNSSFLQVGCTEVVHVGVK